MRYLLSLILGIFFFGNLNAQIGIKSGFRSFHNENWETELSEAFNTGFASMNGWSVGLNYWFRYKKRRIEFTPEIALGQYNGSTNDFNNDYEREHNFISFHFNTNIYLFDLAEDCDCPVWSKDGNFLKKGFFLQVSPGVTRMNNVLGGQLENSDETQFYPELGVGAGIDIGLSDFFTITPMAKLFFSKDAEWNNVFTPLDSTPIELKGTSQQFFAGIKLGFRFDELRGF